MTGQERIKQHLSTFELSCSSHQFVEIFFSDEGFFSSFLNEHMLEKDVTISPWNPTDDNGFGRKKYDRKIVSQHPLPLQLYWLPNYIESNVVQHIELQTHNDDLHSTSILITNSALVNGIPFVKPHVVTEWIVKESKGKRNFCIVTLSLYFIFEYTSSWIQPLVESHSYRELMIYIDKFKKVADQLIISWLDKGHNDDKSLVKINKNLKFLFDGEMVLQPSPRRRISRSVSHSQLESASTHTPLKSLASLSAAIHFNKIGNIGDITSESTYSRINASIETNHKWLLNASAFSTLPWGQIRSYALPPFLERRLFLIVILLCFKIIDFILGKLYRAFRGGNDVCSNIVKIQSPLEHLLIPLISAIIITEVWTTHFSPISNQVTNNDHKAGIPIFSYNCNRSSSMLLSSADHVDSFSHASTSPCSSPIRVGKNISQQDDTMSKVVCELPIAVLPTMTLQTPKDGNNHDYIKARSSITTNNEHQSQGQVHSQQQSPPPTAPVYWIIPGIW